MILDSVENIARYKGISAGLDTAIACIQATDFSALAAGRYPVDGDTVYYMVQTPALKARPDTKWEAHHAYIDIQYALKDGEAIEYAPLSQVDGWEAYNPEKDIQLSFSETAGIVLPLRAGEFAIFFPQDAHRPCEKTGSATEGLKVVIKVQVE